MSAQETGEARAAARTGGERERQSLSQREKTSGQCVYFSAAHRIVKSHMIQHMRCKITHARDERENKLDDMGSEASLSFGRTCGKCPPRLEAPDRCGRVHPVSPLGASCCLPIHLFRSCHRPWRCCSAQSRQTARQAAGGSGRRCSPLGRQWRVLASVHKRREVERFRRRRLDVGHRRAAGDRVRPFVPATPALEKGQDVARRGGGRRTGAGDGCDGGLRRLRICV